MTCDHAYQVRGNPIILSHIAFRSTEVLGLNIGLRDARIPKKIF